MSRRIKKRLAAVMVLSLMISGITAPTHPAGAASKLKLNKKKASLKVGQKLMLKVTGTKKKVKWASNKKTVAVVSSKGKVTARKEGSAKITAKVAGKKLTCKVTVAKTAKTNKTPVEKPSKVPTETVRPTQIPTSEPTATQTPIPEPTVTPTSEPIETLDPTQTPSATETPTPVQTPTPTATPVPPDTSQDNVTKNLEKLKKHIEEKGERNKDGDKQITFSINDSNMVAGQCALIYDKKDNYYSFVTTKVYETWSYTHGIFLNLDSSTVNSIYMYKSFYTNTFTAKSSYTLIASCKFDELEDPLDLDYKVTDSKNHNVQVGEIILANVFCNTAFKDWDKYLKDNVSLSFKDIGLTNIKLE